MAESDRDILFANETFVIGILQAVSGGSVVAALSQSDALVSYAGPGGFLGFLSAMAVALLAAVLAAYWKHQYKMWDVKAGVSVSQGNRPEATARSESSNKYLKWMRRAMLVAVVAISLAIGGLVIAIWIEFLRNG